jgi:hypothetical protein
MFEPFLDRRPTTRSHDRRVERFSVDVTDLIREVFVQMYISIVPCLSEKCYGRERIRVLKTRRHLNRTVDENIGRNSTIEIENVE